MPVRMTRKVGFSSGHRYWITGLSEAENRARFGEWASAYNHGHNYTLWVTVQGEVDPLTGMIVNIKDIDEVLQRLIVSRFDGKSINDEIDWFATRSSSTENILTYIAEILSAPGSLPAPVRLTHLKLEEMPLLYAELELGKESRMTLTRTYEFCASHRLHVPSLSHEENEELFGKCNNPAGHGHNYILEVTVEGVPDEKTGMMADIGAIDEVVDEAVVNRYDHKHFNLDIPEFQGRPTSSEMIAQEIFDRLTGRLPARLVRIRLHETARNIFEVTA